MKEIAAAVVVCCLCVATGAQQSPDVSGEWVLTTDIMGTPLHQHLTLKAEQGKLAGAIHRTSHSRSTTNDGHRHRAEQAGHAQRGRERVSDPEARRPPARRKADSWEPGRR